MGNGSPGRATEPDMHEFGPPEASSFGKHLILNTVLLERAAQSSISVLHLPKDLCEQPLHVEVGVGPVAQGGMGLVPHRDERGQAGNLFSGSSGVPQERTGGARIWAARVGHAQPGRPEPPKLRATDVVLDVVLAQPAAEEAATAADSEAAPGAPSVEPRA